MKKILQSGPIKYSEPEKVLESPRMIEYEKIEYKGYPNNVKLDIEEGEDRFPADAKVPNKKKYSKDGTYIKHKITKKKEKDSKQNIEASGFITRQAALSNKSKKSG